MGYTCSAHLYVGLRIASIILEKKTKNRGCSHKETNNKFCSTCSKPMWEVGREVPEWVENMQHDKFDVTSESCESNVLFVGKQIAEVYDKNSVKVEKFDVDKILTKIRTEFSKEPWYNEKEMFGIWLVRYESY